LEPPGAASARHGQAAGRTERWHEIRGDGNQFYVAAGRTLGHH